MKPVRSTITRVLLVVAAVACVSCNGDPGGPGPGPVLPEPFPDCPANRICTFTFNLGGHYTPAYQSALDKFDYVILNKNGVDDGMAAAASPDVPVVLYEPMRVRMHSCGSCEYEDWATIDAHEEWFWHDASGNRVRDGQWPLWYMDYRNTEYLDYLIARFLRLKTENPAIDGFFMDQNGPYSGFTRYAVPQMDPSPISPLPTEAEFDLYNTAALTRLKSGLGRLHLVLNSNCYPGFYAGSDGSMDEGFAHDNFVSDSLYSTETAWKAQVDRLADPAAAGKFLFPFTKCQTAEYATHALRYGLASYLLGRRADGYAFFCFMADTDSLPGYFAEYDTPTGAPLGTYYQDASGLWVREFENGIAVVHADFSKSDLTLALTGGLAGQYVDWDGACYSGTAVIPTNTGHFLLRSSCTP